MEQKRSFSYMIILIVVVCGLMAFVDAVLSPPYFVKSAVKLVLFLAIPVIFSIRYKEINIREVFRIEKRNIILPILLGIGVYAFIMGAYFIIGPYFDFTNVTVALADNYGGLTTSL